MIRRLFKPSASLSRRELVIWGVLWLASGVALWSSLWLNQTLDSSYRPARITALAWAAPVVALYAGVAVVVYGATLAAWLCRGLGLMDRSMFRMLIRAHQGPLRLTTVMGVLLAIVFVVWTWLTPEAHIPGWMPLIEVCAAAAAGLWSVVNGVRCCSRKDTPILPSSLAIAVTLALLVVSVPTVVLVQDFGEQVWRRALRAHYAHNPYRPPQVCDEPSSPPVRSHERAKPLQTTPR